MGLGQHPQSEDPALKLHIDSSLDVAQQLRSCFGPNGLPKTLAFRFIRGLSAPTIHTPDTESVLTHMDLKSPAARVLASAAIAQAQVVGDGSGLVVLLGAGLLEQARVLLDLGLTKQEVEEGYRLACAKALEVIDSGDLVVSHLENPCNEQDVANIFKTLLATRFPEAEYMLAEAMARCCIQALTVKDGTMTFNPDAIQIIKSLVRDNANQGEDHQSEEEEDSGRGSTDEKLLEEIVTEKPQEEHGAGPISERSPVEVDKNWGECVTQTKAIKPKGSLGDNKPGVETGQETREFAIVHQLLQDYAEAKRWGKVPRCSGCDCHVEELDNGQEQEDDWEILSLALEDIRLEADDAAGGLGAWERQGDAEEEVILLGRDEEGKAHGDWQERRPREEFRKGRTALKKSTVTCKRLFRGLIRLGKKYLGRRRGGVELKKHGQVRRLHRPLGRLHQTSKTNKEKYPLKSHISKEKPTKAIGIKAKVAYQNVPDQESQCVTIRLYSPDLEKLDSSVEAARACLRLYLALLSDPRLVSGAGCCEVALSVQLCNYGLTLPGLEQIAVHCFAEALLAPVKALSENRGTPSCLAIQQLHEVLRHRGSGPQTQGQEGEGVLDPLVCKTSALKKATSAALSIISVLLN